MSKLAEHNEISLFPTRGPQEFSGQFEENPGGSTQCSAARPVGLGGWNCHPLRQEIVSGKPGLIKGYIEP